MEKRIHRENGDPIMNILMVHPHDLHSPQEPWTVRIRFLARELAESGHNITLAHHRLEGKRVIDESGLENIEVIELGRNLSALEKNTRLLKKYARRADIIHIQKCMPHAVIPTLWAAYMTGRPIHYDWDDWEYKIQEIETNGHAPAWLELMERSLPRLVDTVSVASELLRRLAERAGIPDERIFSTPVGADLTLFGHTASGAEIKRQFDIHGPIVMYLGQLHATQYVEQFLEAGVLLLEKQPSVTLMVVGSGWRLPELQLAAKSMGIHDRVIFTGTVPYRRIPEFLAAADIAVACFEDNEATRAKSPLKVVEYLAGGKAIVASSVGEVERMVSGCGVLVPPGDIHALSDAINELLLDPDRRRAFGKKARERAFERHSWESVARNLERAYAVALSE